MINGDGLGSFIEFMYRLLIGSLILAPFGIWKVLELFGVL